MNRRNLIVAGGAALVHAPSGAFAREQATPVQQIYREWKRHFDQSNDSGLKEDEFERCVELYHGIGRLDAVPAQTMLDLALKIRVACGDWAFLPGPDINPGLCAEIDALVRAWS